MKVSEDRWLMIYVGPRYVTSINEPIIEQRTGSKTLYDVMGRVVTGHDLAPGRYFEVYGD